jgi:hypothetical protein
MSSAQTGSNHLQQRKAGEVDPFLFISAIHIPQPGLAMVRNPFLCKWPDIAPQRVDDPGDLMAFPSVTHFGGQTLITEANIRQFKRG